MRINVPRVIMAIAVLVVVLLIGILIGMNIKKGGDHASEAKPVAMSSDRTWSFTGDSEVGGMIYDNYWNYVRASYIIIGDIPDCQLYKIAVGAPRNDYVRGNFYRDGDYELMAYHDNEGKIVSKTVVDLSSFQENIDFAALKKAGVYGVCLRTGFRGYGSGSLVEDDNFRTFYKDAKKAGLKIGVYFYSQAISEEEAVEEAEFVLNLLKGKKIELPVAFDTEGVYDEDARGDALDVDQRTDCTIAFCERIKDAGYEPMIYSNRNWFVQNLDMSRLYNYKLWIAHYTDSTDFPYVYNGWQYTDSEVLPGSDTPIDASVWIE